MSVLIQNKADFLTVSIACAIAAIAFLAMHTFELKAVLSPLPAKNSIRPSDFEGGHIQLNCHRASGITSPVP